MLQARCDGVKATVCTSWGMFYCSVYLSGTVQMLYRAPVFFTCDSSFTNKSLISRSTSVLGPRLPSDVISGLCTWHHSSGLSGLSGLSDDCFRETCTSELGDLVSSLMVLGIYTCLFKISLLVRFLQFNIIPGRLRLAP